jgi:hypothetical protein
MLRGPKARVASLMPLGLRIQRLTSSRTEKLWGRAAQGPRPHPSLLTSV